jgi:hypothetical protein
LAIWIQFLDIRNMRDSSWLDPWNELPAVAIPGFDKSLHMALKIWEVVPDVNAAEVAHGDQWVFQTLRSHSLFFKDPH